MHRIPLTKTTLLALALGGGLLLALALSAPSANAVAKGPRTALSTLVRQTNHVPRRALSKARQRGLLRIARHARRAAGKHACVAVHDLARYRRLLARVHVKNLKGKRNRRARNHLARLGPTSLVATKRLLASKKTRRCGGGVKLSTRHEAQTKVVKSDANQMKVKVLLPAVQFSPATGGGKTWTKLGVHDTDIPATPGTPSVPEVSSDFAVPDGAKVTVTQGATKSVTLQSVDVFPAQPDPADRDTQAPDIFAPPFATPKFKIDRDAYKSDSLFPSKPAAAGILGNVRDLGVGGLQVPAGQYNPHDGTLKLFKSVTFTVKFTGGTHTFSDELSSPWEQPARDLLSTLLNSRIVDTGRVFRPRRCGEEMLVITNPATQAAADTFANAKRAQGMRTAVVDVGAAAGQIGTTPTEIQTYIRSELTRFLCIHPSYVTIMGDDDLVPTNNVTASPGCCGYAGGIPSDLPYALRDDADELPDVAVGRFIGDDNAAVTVAVNKVISYENSPPPGAWLRHATIAAEFQDDNVDGQEDRTFALFAETLRDGLRGLGVSIDRVYKDSPTTTPAKFNDGTAVPASLQKPTFAWNGTGTDAANDWNAGRFMMVHRDHGYSDGWVTPALGTAQVDALTNGAQLPVVLSINCSSAAYDYDETSFVGESLVNPNGGAAGAFGDTRDSPTWHNSQIALGFADALIPRVLPAEGPATKQRTGQALMNGKMRLAGLASPATDGDSRNELLLWHYFGDPSMQMWGGDPIHIWDVVSFSAVYASGGIPGDPGPYHVNVQLPPGLNGQAISLLQDGQVIGKATAHDGQASVPADFDSDNKDVGDLKVAIDSIGSEPVTIPVSGETSLSQTCPDDVSFNSPATVRGKLSPGFANASITVTWTRPGGRGSFDHTVTTDAQGNWTDTISTGRDDPNGGGNGGTWLVHATYGGDESHAGSSTRDCSFQEASG